MILRSIMAALLLVTTCITKDPTYAVAAGLFELAGVLYGVLYGITRPRRLTIKEIEKAERHL